jgi:hypothetical protein
MKKCRRVRKSGGPFSVKSPAPIQPGKAPTLWRQAEQRMMKIIVPREAKMARMLVDCRDYPSEMNCTDAISADTQKELVDAAVQHAVAYRRLK